MGESRAKYGSKVIKTLSEKLQKEFGKGFSEDTLKNARKFYLTYKERISETVFSLFEKEPPFIVSWSHYLQLMRIENEAERSFYEIETATGLKSSSWTCCGLVLSFGLTTLNLVPCGFGSSDASAGAVTSDVAISFWCWFCIISTTS